jgi:putative polyhydroxyalkanoate system protein
MATIDISKAHSLPLAEAKSKAEELAKGMQSRLGLDYKWEGDTIHFNAPSGTAKGTKGEVAVTDKTVRVIVDLPFLLRVMKGTIEEKINDQLKKLL